MSREFRATRRALTGGLAVATTSLTLGKNVFAQSSTPDAGASLVIYSGRNEALVGPLIEQLAAGTGVNVEVRYGGTGELAAQILEEGDNTPAALFLSQDAGALGALANAGRFTTLPDDILAMVDPTLSDSEGRWVGVSGRARVVVFQPDLVDEADIPESILDLPEAELGTIGFAPTNASFQTFVTALRLQEGEDGAKAWLEALNDGDSVIFEGNGAIVDAVANGEIAMGLVNHYYLYQKLKETPDITAQNHYYLNGDIGGLINVAGVGVIAGNGQEMVAEYAVRALLGEMAQTYFAEQTSEYPLASGVSPVADLPPLDEYQLPDINLNDLDDLEGTVNLLTELGLI
ncbi:MAG: extracellular solute-binding protein [Thermomicrobiales bacterium]|nr:extracellular solute-binding protein [Thermomicrobiales bacterium]